MRIVGILGRRPSPFDARKQILDGTALLALPMDDAEPQLPESAADMVI
ncbi:hypothetical protein [Limnoglobus roseus]|nr:hypothetical protein [Limnoglobus roseus]